MEVYGIIYKAVNTINGKIYIGQTIRNLEIRKYFHKYDSLNGMSDLVFHRAIRKYGWDNFDWQIIDKCYNIDELNDKEVYWIDYYKSYVHRYNSNGYNTTIGGSATTGYVYSQEQADNISKSKGIKPFYIFDFNRKIIGEYNNLSKCARELGLTGANIGNVLTRGQRHVKGYIAIFKHEFTLDLLEEKINKAKDNSHQIREYPTKASLTYEEVVDIKKSIIDGSVSLIDLSIKYNVKRQIIYKIAKGQTYKNVVVDGFEPIEIGFRGEIIKGGN